jgi:hypothetical protein
MPFSKPRTCRRGIRVCEEQYAYLGKDVAEPQELAFNDLMQPGWKRDFVKILGSEILEEESTSSPQFTVPADSRLEIVVEDSVVSKIKLTLKYKIVRRCQPPTTSSGSEATTASPAASPSGTDLHTE